MFAPFWPQLLAVFPVLLDAPHDADKDGLSDFAEIHKYLTDPRAADSDGDGVPDGDWNERREYAYTVRSVVQVMRPVTPAFLNDAYQDARVLDETETFVELEVIHYPLVDLTGAGPDGSVEELSRWLKPGPTSNGSPELGQAILAAMEEDGTDVPDLSQGRGVAEAAAWLLDRAKHKDRFTSFITGVDPAGRFFIPEAFRDYARHQAMRGGLSVEEIWPRELEAAGMFEHEERGSCSSSAIYLSGCLRALGVPTRTVLCIPIIDAGDEREWELLARGIEHHELRAGIEAALAGSRKAWSSHTFNEVHVEGRWHRLNYGELDAGIWNRGFFGLMTHVATFHDWADARMWETIGVRSKLSNTEKKLDVFGHHNPYSTISLRDSFGVHCAIQNPPVESRTMAVESVYWTDSKDLPKDIAESNRSRGRFGLIAEVPARSMGEVLAQLGRETAGVTLSGADGANFSTKFHPGCVWFKTDRAYLYLPLEGSAAKKVAAGVTYRVTTQAAAAAPRWVIEQDIAR